MFKKIHRAVIYVVYGSLALLATDACAAEIQTETGIASYYSNKLHGRKTSSGQRYDKNKLTAAHKTLPLGTQIEVTNLHNQSSVIVTINDRGPFIRNRKLDLSYAAAKEIGLLARGSARVSYSLVNPSEQNSDFEKVIPREYPTGLVGMANSEEEVIEAEEELAVAEQKNTMHNTLTGTETLETLDTQTIEPTLHHHRHFHRHTYHHFHRRYHRR
jgi:rare lipoprotein A